MEADSPGCTIVLQSSVLNSLVDAGTSRGAENKQGRILFTEILIGWRFYKTHKLPNILHLVYNCDEILP